MKRFRCRSVRSVKYAIDVYPEARNIVMRGEQVIQNPIPQPINEIHFTIDPNYLTEIRDSRSVAQQRRSKALLRIYKFDPPLQPGESRTMQFTVKSKNRGFENDVSTVELVQNGTFFNNTIGPVIGYQSARQLTDPNDRKKIWPQRNRSHAAAGANCTDDCTRHISGRPFRLGGRADRHQHFADQLAIAPGSLLAGVAGERPALFRIQA